MPTDWELWAAANHVLERHGSEAPLFVAARINALGAAADLDGVAVWKEIARRMTELGRRRSDRRLH